MKNDRSIRVIAIILTFIITIIMIPPGSVLAADPIDIKWPDFSTLDGQVPGLGIPLEQTPSSINSGEYSSWAAQYRETRPDRSEKTISISILYYPDPSKMFSSRVRDIQAQLDANPDKLPIPAINRDVEGLRVIELENPGRYIFTYLYYSPRTGWNGEKALVYLNNYYITVSGKGTAWSNDAEFMEAYNTAVQYVKKAIDGLIAVSKGSLTLKYYDPIIVSSIEGFKGADIVATLKDKNGKSISDKIVYFFKDPSSELKDFFKLPAATGTAPALNINLPQAFDVLSYIITLNPFNPNKYYAVTDKNGVARWNFLENFAYTDWAPLINFKPSSGNPTLDGRIFAVVFDKDPTKSYPTGDAPRIEYAAEVPISFRGVAAITSRGMADSNKVSIIKVGPPGQENTVVKTLPYYLFKGESVKIDSNTILTIKWLSGHVITVKVKQGFTEGGTIYIDYNDAGLYRMFDQYAGNWLVETTLGGGAAALGIYLGTIGEKAAATAIGGPILAIVLAAGVIGYEGVKSAYDPLIMEPRSQILIDMEEGFSVYTLEGNAKLYNIAGESIEVPGGNTASMSSDGQFGTVQKFKDCNLNDDLRTINKSMAVMHEIQSGSSSGSSGSNGIIIGVIVGIVVIGGVIFGFSRRRKRA